ncbi:MAG TPA: sensor histidine kinase [Clostridia bacterium]|nr:sensor histidine kinase [Clostridia bacterium]
MDKLKKYLLPAIFVALFGEIYFYPINSSLRISAGIIALNLIVLIADDISEYYTAVFAGVIVFLLRIIIGVYFSGIPFTDIIQYNLPSVAYYLAYGFLILLLRIRKYKEHFFPAIFLFSLTDSLSNTVEVLIRDGIVSFDIIQVFILIGLVRSIAAYFIYLLYKNQELFILRREHQKRYSQLNILISDIQAEMFYLKKSMGDIENVMSKSYKLYEKHKENEDLQEDTLNIAREVHEIKKEYYRILSGFQSFLKSFENNGTMTLKDMHAIIKDNTNRYLSEHEKKITMHFNFRDDFKLKKYYSLFTILNNLIINAIDACDIDGIIKVSEKSDEDNIYFCVEDNGVGIEKDILPYIFNPGFTTKYYDNGKASTGIGLSHVKNIVEELRGNINVGSALEAGTIFEITLPKNSLLG